MKVKIKQLYRDSIIPNYKYIGDSGADLYSRIEYLLLPFERQLFPTGISIELPKGHEIQIRPKSGLAINYGITVLNSPGTIDSGYTGEIKVILINLSNSSYHISKGDSIAQMVVCPVIYTQFKTINNFFNLHRKASGFGNTIEKEDKNE